MWRPSQKSQARTPVRRNLPKSLRLSDAQAITIVTLDEISTTVLTVASGTLRIESPRGHVVAPMRSMM